MNCAPGSRVGSAVYRPSTSDSSTRQSALTICATRAAEAVVVAVADLGGRDRVVLVDDRDRAEAQQRRERVAGVQVAAPLLGVAEREQHLRDREAALLEHFLPGVREADLADGRRGLLLLELRACRAPRPSSRRPSAMAPEDTSTTSWPRARRCREVLGQRLEPGAVDAAGRLLDQQRGTDLDDDPPGRGQARSAGRGPARHANAKCSAGSVIRPAAAGARRGGVRVDARQDAVEVELRGDQLGPVEVGLGVALGELLRRHARRREPAPAEADVAGDGQVVRRRRAHFLAVLHRGRAELHGELAQLLDALAELGGERRHLRQRHRTCRSLP